MFPDLVRPMDQPHSTTAMFLNQSNTADMDLSELLLVNSTNKTGHVAYSEDEDSTFGNVTKENVRNLCAGSLNSSTAECLLSTNLSATGMMELSATVDDSDPDLLNSSLETSQEEALNSEPLFLAEDLHAGELNAALKSDSAEADPNTRTDPRISRARGLLVTIRGAADALLHMLRTVTSGAGGDHDSNDEDDNLPNLNTSTVGRIHENSMK
ncbi:unnamed protein product [Gongylonema pulchrum]|uniref:RNASEK-C17orf49 readthrough (Non-protein coding) n=1 Tax=Gongylonema pulchrum TaxID=637853 RepID=A0A183DJW2_9BILA|nr:unnamed protein product [Gongylonema pulchrum]